MAVGTGTERRVKIAGPVATTARMADLNATVGRAKIVARARIATALHAKGAVAPA